MMLRFSTFVIAGMRLLAQARNRMTPAAIVALILRSALFARVSKDGNEGARGHPSRRGQAAAPQDEGGT